MCETGAANLSSSATDVLYIHSLLGLISKLIIIAPEKTVFVFLLFFFFVVFFFIVFFFFQLKTTYIFFLFLHENISIG